MLTRRNLILGSTALASAAGLWWLYGGSEAMGRFEIERSNDEWRSLLTRAQFDVLRLHRTEPPGSSPLNHEKRKGTYACAGCALPLFSSDTKYDSRTGWPSFYQPLAQRARHQAGLCVAHSAHRGALPALRRASRACVRGRTAADRAALLHQRRGAGVHAVAAGGLGQGCIGGHCLADLPGLCATPKPIFTALCAECRLSGAGRVRGGLVGWRFPFRKGTDPVSGFQIRCFR